MDKLRKLLDGKKTWIVVLAATAVFAGQLLGYVDGALAEKAYTLLGIGGAATLRSAIKKVER